MRTIVIAWLLQMQLVCRLLIHVCLKYYFGVFMRHSVKAQMQIKILLSTLNEMEENVSKCNAI